MPRKKLPRDTVVDVVALQGPTGSLDGDVRALLAAITERKTYALRRQRLTKLLAQMEKDSGLEHRRAPRTHERSALTAFSEEPDQPSITDPEKHQQAMAAAEQMRARGNEPTATIGLTFIRAASALMTLSRYETSLERSYYRALHELQRLQHARLGGHVPPPLALDVTVSGQDNDEAVRSGRLDSDGAELTTSDATDSAEQSHGRDESAASFLRN